MSGRQGHSLSDWFLKFLSTIHMHDLRRLVTVQVIWFHKLQMKTPKYLRGKKAYNPYFEANFLDLTLAFVRTYCFECSGLYYCREYIELPIHLLAQ